MASESVILDEMTCTANLYGVKAPPSQLQEYHRALVDMPDSLFRVRMRAYRETSNVSRLPTPGQIRSVEIPHHNAYEVPLHPAPARGECFAVDSAEERFRTLPQCFEECSPRLAYVETSCDWRAGGVIVNQSKRDALWTRCGGDEVPRTGAAWSPEQAVKMAERGTE